MKLGRWVGGKHLGRVGRVGKGNDYDQNILCENFLRRRKDLIKKKYNITV